MFSSLFISLFVLTLGADALKIPEPVVPKTVVIDGQRMAKARTSLKLGDKKLKKALKALTTEADSWLTKGPWTVTSKPNPPPSGNIHDYLSQAPYWYADELSRTLF